MLGMVAKKGQLHLLSAHVKLPAVVLLTTRQLIHCAQLMGNSLAYRVIKPPAVVLITTRSI